MKIKCDQKGCDFEVSHHNQLTAKAMLGKHKKAAHGFMSKAAEYYYNKKSRNSEVDGDKPERKPYTRQIVPNVNFCPGCGCNLHAVAVAMSLRK